MTPEQFIDKWQGTGGFERGNSQLFLAELCDVLGVDRPMGVRREDSDGMSYCFERPVRALRKDGSATPNYIDLYRRGAFVLESKQGRLNDEQLAQQALPGIDMAPAAGGGRTRGSAAWKKYMDGAFYQAQRYVVALHDEGEARPPFVIVCDVGYCLELYADFSLTGRTYQAFPDPKSNRIALADLTDPAVRQRLAQVWVDPMALDPTAHSARVTRAIARELAAVARALERDYAPDRVAEFLMRCLFTMFAEDVDLLPERSFTQLLVDRRDEPEKLAGSLTALWRSMNDGGFDSYLGQQLPHFNGALFKDAEALILSPGQIDHLLEAARADWTEVEPAIFGTLLERALDPRERHRLGAHFTPREYVEMLVQPTIVEPLRAQWRDIQAATTAEAARGRLDAATDLLRDFHRELTTIKVLDPACGTGNFLYVALEHMKRLEGEVLNTLADLGDGQEDLYAINPSQFLGLEKNPRAKPIAEMVLWIGYLQWHFRTRAKRSLPRPVLKAYDNITLMDAVLAHGAPTLKRDERGRPVSVWDGLSMKTDPATGREVPDEAARVEDYVYPSAKPATWPKADFIVGNPPFVGNWRMRGELGHGYTETLRKAYPKVPRSVDYVMYWWHKAAELVRTGKARRFGLITTNSLRQTFARRVIAQHMDATKPLSLTFAVPDHPWVDEAGSADVRIAMTVGVPGDGEGVLQEVAGEAKRPDGLRAVTYKTRRGKIHDNLTIGAHVSAAQPLKANDFICSPGVKLHGAGFIVTSEKAAELGLGRMPGLDDHIRPYRNGRDLMATPRGAMVIDLYGLPIDAVQRRFPEVYQHLTQEVRPGRESRRGSTPDSTAYANDWWLFGKTRPELRKALGGLPRYIATVETAKHRVFQFLDAAILPDNKLINIALDDGWQLAVLSGQWHVRWAMRAGGWMGVGNDSVYVKSRCFDPFPFPLATEDQKARLRDLGERLDAHRKRQQDLHPDLTLTGIYNVLEAVRAGRDLTAKERDIHQKGLIGILAELHDRIDAAVAEAYGWPADLPAEQVLERLVALNLERKAAEAEGAVHWLRPEFQAPDETAAPVQHAISLPEAVVAAGLPRVAWPKRLPERIRYVREALEAAEAPIAVDAVARRFKNARRADVAELLDTLVVLRQAESVGEGRYIA